MRRPFSSFFTLDLFLFLFLLFFIHGVTCQEFIKNTCKLCAKGDPNIHSGFCTTSLQAAPASRCATLSGLGKISIRLIQDNVTDTRCYIKTLLNNKKLDHFIIAYLHDCFELYSDAVDSVRKVVKSYRSRRFYEANIQISSIMDAATTCEDGFKERKGLVSPLTKRNNDTFELSAVFLSLMNMLQEGSH